jgi:thiosulfate/3-mercaptopyruvate sulfurtransferase
MKINLFRMVAAPLALAACAPQTASEGAVMPVPVFAAGEPAGLPQVNANLLVSSEWLAGHLNDPDLVLLHVAPNRTAYDQGHIPGARFLPVSAILTEHEGNINELPPVERLDSVFEAVGVSDHSRIVIYGPSLSAARAFFTLDYLGHGDRAALLNGSIEAWRAGGRAVNTEVASIRRGSFTPRPQAQRVVDANWVSAQLRNPRVALIDARPGAQFTGVEAGEGIARPGHIPGARNVFWEDLLVSRADPRLRDIPSLQSRLREAGVNPGDTVVAYCRSGMQASMAYFVARYLGYETRMYDGSFLDWSRRTSLPVER